MLSICFLNSPVFFFLNILFKIYWLRTTKIVDKFAVSKGSPRSTPPTKENAKKLGKNIFISQLRLLLA